MAVPGELILGEFRRTLDERFRLSIPPEIVDGADPAFVLAKERLGCLSLWKENVWQEKLSAGLGLIRAKVQAGKLDGRLFEVQRLGRLLSTRHVAVALAGRGRLLIPEGFREFLGVEAGGEVLIVGAAVCVEIWRPQAWVRYLGKRMPRFNRLFEDLAS